MSRGARFYDSDFFLWVSNAVRGLQPLRRNLVLVHFIGYRPLAAALPGDKGSIFPDEIAVTSLATRIPGRAWFMAGCLPSRYKAGGDFDAMASDVSVQELEVQPEYVHELTIATLSPILGKAFSLAAGTFEAVTSARDF
jgi:hypothetical protein